MPFGIAQIGKAFRNEITPGNFIFRTREFEQMEMQFFVEPGDGHDSGSSTGRPSAWRGITTLGLAPRAAALPSAHGPDELAHYAAAAFDIEFDFGGTLGFQEIEGIHNRGDFDLARTRSSRGKRLEYFDQPQQQALLPVHHRDLGAVPTASTLAVLVNAYREEEVEGEDEGRTVLGLHPSLAPIKAGVFPLVKKDGNAGAARTGSRANCGRISGGSTTRREHRPAIPPAGRSRHALLRHGGRQTVEDGTVTVRDRDTLNQDRISADALRGYLRSVFRG